MYHRTHTYSKHSLHWLDYCKPESYVFNKVAKCNYSQRLDSLTTPHHIIGYISYLVQLRPLTWLHSLIKNIQDNPKYQKAHLGHREPSR